MAQLRRNTHIPTATGERLYSRFDCGTSLARCWDITSRIYLMPVALPSARKLPLWRNPGSGLAPHCPLGPIALAACLQIDAVSQMRLFKSKAKVFTTTSNDLTDYLSDPSVLHFSDDMLISSVPGWESILTRTTLSSAAKRAIAGTIQYGNMGMAHRRV